MARASAAQRDDAEVSRFIERFALDLTAAGVPRMPARVFAALLTSDTGTMTAMELADVLQVSPASISGAVRYLIQVGLLHREREPGSRRDHYVLSDDVWHEVVGRRDQVLARWQDTMAQGVDVLGAGTPAGERMIETLAFFGFLQEEMHVILKKWEARRADLRGKSSGGA